ncbi:hypothetical protein [Shewanella woodyi]|uniref:hypothetical protein n=1 Tax=Shewanella woodyi TaxID=60961 RepID=UPI0007EAC904|nr:hypothetical protein [Shewanella woodyi]
MKSLILILAVITVFSYSASAHSAGAWYVGKVKRVALLASDGSFIVTLKNTALDDCQHKYAYFSGSSLGDGRLKNAYAMALTSLTAGLNMGIVIDKARNGPGGKCNAYGMTADLRAN